MKKFQTIFACAVLAALASCSNEHELSQQSAEDTPIRIQANVGGITTRAGSDIQSQYFDANEIIGIFLREHLNSGEKSIISYTQPLDGEVQTSGANATIDIQTQTQYYPSNGHGVDCLAIYPKQNEGANITNTTRTFSVKEDQSDADEYKASDLMYAYTSDKKKSTKGPIKLTFSHLLSKIIVEVCVEASGSVDKSVLKDVCVDLKSVNKTIDITVSDMSQTVGSTTPTTAGSVALTSAVSNETTIVMGKPGVSDSDDKKTNEVAAIIVPQTIADTKPFIQVRLNNGTSNYATYTYNVSNTSGLTFATGKSYKYTITLKSGGISVQSVEITPWTSEAPGSGDAILD